MKKFALLCLMTVVFVACGREKVEVNPEAKEEKQEEKLVNWAGDYWDLAKLVEPCDDDGGWFVNFNNDFLNPHDNSAQFGGDQFFNEKPKCFAKLQIIENKAPDADQVKVGDVILAKEFIAEAFYSGKILEIDGDRYKVQYLTLNTSPEVVSLSDIRLLPVAQR